DPQRGSLDAEEALVQGLILQRQLDRLSLPEDIAVGRVIQPASIPSSPVSPNHVVNGLFGLVAGLGLGVGLAFLRDRMSGRLRSSEEVEDYLGASVLGAIPPVPQWRRRKNPLVVTRTHWHSPASEAYRILRTNVLSITSRLGVKTVVVSSAHSGEGKSATVANLAVVLARAGKRVSLVSADLRRPRLHQFFGIDGGAGLSDVLAGRLPLDQALQKVTFATSVSMDHSSVTLRILPSGRVPENPAELLQSESMKQVLTELGAISDIVLIDVPPILPVTDALVVASIAGGVLLVVGPKGNTRSAILSARQQLDRVNARIIGGVLNGPEASSIQTYTY
ncbi:MAG: polysaccharide biosynthesis tyrosine autokinase, partial [Actinomycetota bacterium]